MVHESLRNLQLDRRLLRRRGWIDPEALEKELSSLPDASDKIDPREEEPEEAERAPDSPSGGDPG
jgi:hypothetical protein